MQLNATDVACIICVDLSENAVETSCCRQLFCEKCLKGLKSCPMCRHFPLLFSINGLARRLVGSRPTTCPYCRCVVQRNNVEDPNRCCLKRPYTCSIQGCDFVGEKAQFVQHLMKKHEDILVIQFSTKQSK